MRDPDSGKTFPVLHALLPNKKKEGYDLLVNVLKRARISAPKVVHVDFEDGEIFAFKKNYPEAQIMGCDVHFSRFVWLDLCL